MTELSFPELTGTKTDCLFGEVGFIFCVLIKALWLTSPTGISKRLGAPPWIMCTIGGLGRYIGRYIDRYIGR